MKTFFDLMRDAQEGAMPSLFAQQFGLTPTEQAQALQAMMPAFWLGLRHNAADPGRFWEAITAAGPRAYADNPSAVFTPAAMAAGNAMLERILGSKDMARMVALQVEAMTGIGQDVVRRMMPVVANLMAGGIEREREPSADLFERFLGLPPRRGEPEGEITDEEIVDRFFEAGRTMQEGYLKAMRDMFAGIGGPTKR